MSHTPRFLPSEQVAIHEGVRAVQEERRSGPLRYICCIHCIHPPLSTNGHDDPCSGCISECPHAEAEADVERAGRAGLWKVTLTCHGCEAKTTTVFATPQGWQS